jgi:hypothetical protein
MLIARGSGGPTRAGRLAFADLFLGGFFAARSGDAPSSETRSSARSFLMGASRGAAPPQACPRWRR